MPEIAKVSYTHDAMIDLIIGNPHISQGQIARHFGYTQGWISQVFSSDSFKKRLAERKADLVDPTIVASVEAEFESLTRLSVRIVRENLERNENAQFALDAMAVASKALGFGARPSAVGAQIQNNVVVVVPPKSASSEDWARDYQPAVAG